MLTNSLELGIWLILVDPARTLPKGQTASSTEPLCVVRATDGASGTKKIKISTLVRLAILALYFPRHISNFIFMSVF